MKKKSKIELWMLDDGESVKEARYIAEDEALRTRHSENCLEAHQGVGKGEGFTCTDNCYQKQHTPTEWYLVTNTPGVDIRHKFDGQELTLIEHANHQIANKIVRAVNSHEELVRVLKAMRDQIDKHFYKLPEDNENDGKYWKRLYDSACELIAQAEGNI